MEYTSYKQQIHKYEIDPTRPSIPPKTFEAKTIRTISVSDHAWLTAAVLAKILNTSKSNVLEFCLRYFENDKEELVYFKDKYIKNMLK